QGRVPDSMTVEGNVTSEILRVTGDDPVLHVDSQVLDREERHVLPLLNRRSPRELRTEHALAFGRCRADQDELAVPKPTRRFVQSRETAKDAAAPGRPLRLAVPL